MSQGGDVFQGLDQTQIDLMKEECILINENDQNIGSASKKTCHLLDNINKGRSLGNCYISKEDIDLVAFSSYVTSLLLLPPSSNTHAPLTQRSWSGLTMLLSKHKVGEPISQETSSHATHQ